eukprot:TRINITY_DN5795_c0_g1_i3.p1 TRINITY_DN5795_c0_g1~~TRINITY_DN5795_c0_g1_i3.p1  ORF type:complete len:384 (-),score=68.40 TRINITY_DN5795_c0_g1_i3:112-1263(-)
MEGERRREGGGDVPDNFNWQNVELDNLIIHERLGARSHKGFQRFYGTSCAVYRVSLKSFPHCNFAMKVLYRYDIHQQQTIRIKQGLQKEVAISKTLEKDNEGLQYITILHSFIDRVDGRLMDWDAEEAETKTLFLIMPLAERTLSQEIQARNESFGEVQVVFIMRSLLVLVDKLNKKHGIVHRDIKPDNIFLFLSNDNPFGYTIALGDFGEAWDAKTGGYPDLRMPYPVDCVQKGGADFYLAPEVQKMVPGPNHFLNYQKNDVYAVGVVGLQLVCEQLFRPVPEQQEAPGALTIKSGMSLTLSRLISTLCHEEFTERPEAHEALNLFKLEEAIERMIMEEVKRMADKKDPEGLYRLGTCYEYGRGVKQDTKIAVELYSMAAPD